MKKIMSLFIIFFGVFLIACTKEKVIKITGVDTVQVGATMKLSMRISQLKMNWYGVVAMKRLLLLLGEL